MGKEIYLENNSLESKILKADLSLHEAVKKVMSSETKTNNYRIHKRDGTERVMFGRDKYNDGSPRMLVLSAPTNSILFKDKLKPIAALRYETNQAQNHYSYEIDWNCFMSYNSDPENFLGINYVQTMAGTTLKNYLKAKKAIGTNPHELLVEDFLSRIAPIIDLRPHTKIVIQPSARTSAKTVRDRFFTKCWELNPNKKRVIQILGQDNAWLKPEAIEQRYAHLK